MQSNEAQPRSAVIGQMVAAIRGRWRLRRGLAGAVVVLAAGVLLLVAASMGLSAVRYVEPWGRVIPVVTYLLIAAALVRYLLTPLTASLPDQRVALYLEEHEPSLDGVVVSAVDSAPPAIQPRGESGLPAKLTERAVAAVAGVDGGRRVERQGLRRSAFALTALLAAAVALGLLGPDVIKHGMRYLLMPWGGAASANPYSVSVEPGDATVLRGSDQRIAALLDGFDTDAVTLATRREDDEAWRERAMVRGDAANGFELFLFDLDEPLSYYVEADGIRTPEYRLEVTEPPAVAAISLEYHYPDNTGLETRSVDDDANITAPKGTRVRVSIRPTQPVPSGALVIEDGDAIALEPNEDGTLGGEIEVERDTSYRVALTAANGERVDASEDYAIDVVENQPPTIAIATPGRDIKVTSVEEPHLQVEASDDYGLSAVELVVSVNGGEEDTVLLGERPKARSLKATHTVYLEDLGLEPGDLIAYYARAREPNGSAPGRESATDMYFMEVRPFRLDYRRAESMGGGGGGAQGEQPGNLSAQQRQFVVATFKLVRDQETYPEQSFGENIATLAAAEEKIVVRAEAIVRRLTGRRMMRSDPAYERVAEELPQAIEAMREAKAQMDARAPEQALPPARKALQHLQRADAAFRELQVAMQQGGGDGRNQDAEDLANLFRLELDKLRNQYENVQRARERTPEQELDETLKRLEELARRQLKQNERMRRRAQRSNNNSSGGGGGSQQALAEEVEKLARQLERLSRKQPSESLEQTRRRLEEAAAEMRRAASGKNQEGAKAGQAAMDRLREARRALDGNSTEQLRRDVGEAERRAGELAETQDGIARGGREGASDPQARDEQVAELLQQKRELNEGLRALQRDLDGLAAKARGEQEEAATKLEQAARSVERNQLNEKIRQSVGALRGSNPQEAQALESEIGAGIEEMREQIAAAADAIGTSRRQEMKQTLERMRELVRDLESMKERMRARARDQAEAQRRGQGESKGQDQARNEGQNQGTSEGESRGEGQSQDQARNEGQNQGNNQGEGRSEGQEQQQSEQGQQDGGQSPGGQTPRSGGRQATARARAQGGGGRFDADGVIESSDVSGMEQFKRELEARRADAEQIRQWLPGPTRAAGDIEAVVEGLRALEAQYGDTELTELARLQADTLERLKALEYALRNQLEPQEQQRLTLSDSDAAPDAFRSAVEEYYRALSELEDGD